MIDHWSDPRTALVVAMYAAAGGACAWMLYATAVRESRAAAGLLWATAVLVCTFLPASNVFFYVGTLIGERLLYMPSIGHCLLAGWAVDAVYNWEWGTGSSTLRRPWKWMVIVVVLVWLCWCGTRTHLRNEDWQTEETLFFKAAEVCPGSAKVHENLGIVHRRYERWDLALEEFRKARELWPDYCEVDYWEGITLLQSGKGVEAVPFLRQSLGCKYTAAKALAVLQEVLHVSAGADEHQRWGEALASHDAPLASDYLRRSATLHITAAATAASKGGDSNDVREHYAEARDALLATEPLLAGQSPTEALCEVKYWLGFCQRELGETIPAFDSLTAALKCPGTRKLASALLLDIQKEHVGDPAVHERWAGAMVELGDPVQAITHLQVAALLYMEGGPAEARMAVRSCTYALTLLEHLRGVEGLDEAQEGQLLA
eukprot:CAMPEP_0114607818 /NCGR_PEP_ID=MMETSP0168-20121206/2259_1 /TAXON_ID=95228 ORGANISM="Vannella sp., Strain DIVA3 517/6/12" /NCGR_SAMPLE_ID=MMETSP0168 /ASSEMBLY_ACC=CAM_ASM_000044 /LENGTH=430 /DNA_ID=CAMNT_0001818697 /DNA_START=24 /DNA_END=1312 /DNA_ORIENTATION=+